MRKSGWMAVLALALAGLLWGCRSLPEQMAGKFSVHKVYGDHMVLQRQKPGPDQRPCRSRRGGKGRHRTGNRAPPRRSQPTQLPTRRANGRRSSRNEAGGPHTVTVSGKEGSTPIVFGTC